MKPKHLIVAIAVLVLCIPGVSQAQFHLSLQPVTGFNFNLHTGSDLESSGTGLGFVIGGDAVMMFSPTIGLISGIRFYDNRSGSTSKAGTENNINYTVDASISLAYLQLENLILIRLPETQLYFVAGPVLGFNIEGSTETTTKLTTPGAQFQGGGTSQVAKASLKDLLVRFELKLGAGYNIPLTKKIIIAPQVTFGYGMTKIVSNVSWRVLTIQALVGVKFNII